MSAVASPTEQTADSQLRPVRFSDYPGQDQVKHNLQVYVAAAQQRQEPLDHVLLHGPPGLGKTTLARIIAAELGVAFQQTSGPAIEKQGDLAGLLAGLEPRAVLFIDEIHRLHIAVEEILYSAMEDYAIDILVGQGHTARTVKMPIAPFTLIGATTRMSLLSSPLRSRFGVRERLAFYEPEALAQILLRSAQIWGMYLDAQGAHQLARRSRGTPRIANRLLRRARDFAQVNGEQAIDAEIVGETLHRLDIDEYGLESMDRLILQTLKERYQGRPVGLETLALSVGEDKTTLEDVHEPYLIYLGFIRRGPRGREISEKGLEHLGATQFL